LTAGRIRIGQWLFARYGGRFVFIARFLPILRNMAAVLAGTNSMAQHNFYFASATAAAAWIMCYGLAAYSFGEAFGNLASPAAGILGLAAAGTVLTVPVFILRYEKRLQAKADSALPEGATAVQPSPGKHVEQFAPSYVAPRRLRIRSTAA
jgi:membrane protein DedA with SNARE-associated domain